MKFARCIDERGDTVYVAPEADGGWTRLSGDPFEGGLTAAGGAVKPVRWLPPIAPRAVLCIGKNYAAHAAEMDSEKPDWPVLFMKNLGAVTAHEQPIMLPAVCGDEVDYEAELAVVIGRAAKNVGQAEALDYVLGYTCANDVSARIWQREKGGGQWIRGKSFDTFAPLGPVVVTADEIPDPQALEVSMAVSGETLQQGYTRNMIFPIAELIAFLSQDTTLLPGTVLLTGTPEGVGWAREPKRTLRPGDETAVTISGIGTLRNSVVSAAK